MSKKKTVSPDVQYPAYCRITEEERKKFAIFALDHHVNRQSLLRASIQILSLEEPNKKEKEIQNLILNRAHYIKETGE